MFEADDQRSRKGRSRLVYTAATTGRRRSRQATAAAIAPSGRRIRVDPEIRDLAAGSGALGQEADTCPLDRDPDIYGIRALKSCRPCDIERLPWRAGQHPSLMRWVVPHKRFARVMREAPATGWPCLRGSP